MFALEQVNKSFEGQACIKGLDLSIAPGTTTVLVGPSGCGKSTLLKLMLGLLYPDQGSVRFADQTVQPDNARALRQRMGYVIQEGGLFPHLTARENITLMSRFLGWPSDVQVARVHGLRSLTDFPGDALDRYPAELSGGQRQRVSLMRALMLNPDVLLLDEPLGALDPMIRRDLQNELKEVFEQLDKTVVLVTHDLGEAAWFADSIVLMRDGEIVQRGSLDDLVTSPADRFVEQFVNAQRQPEGFGA